MVKTTLLTVTMMLGIVVSAWAVVGGGIDNSINNSSDSDSHSSSWADSDSNSKAESHSNAVANSFDNQSQKQDATAIQGQAQQSKQANAQSMVNEAPEIPIYNNVPAAPVRPMIGTSSASVATPWGSATGSIETATGKLSAYGNMIIDAKNASIECDATARMDNLLDDMEKASKPHRDLLIRLIRFII